MSLEQPKQKQKLKELESEYANLKNSIDKTEENKPNDLGTSPDKQRLKKLQEEIKELNLEIKDIEKEIQSEPKKLAETYPELSVYLNDLDEHINKLKEVADSQEPEIRKLTDRLEKLEGELKKEYPDISTHPDQGLKFFSNKFPEKIYQNLFVITCRIAAQEFNFENFAEVEVADFDRKQIQTFARNWFNNPNNLDPVKGENFTKKLSEHKPVEELASNPLLLTLLCLVFQESGDFPENRADLYKEGVAILLKKWDVQRNIERDQAYRHLSPGRKEDLLSQIALTTFERKAYFFKQKDAEQYIAEYICNLPNAEADPETLMLDSGAVLKSIEAQHGLLVERARGIYSFSHLTFQEYFTARKIVKTSVPHVLEKQLKNLASHVTEKRWREVFLLGIGILSEADLLLQCMKQHIDLLIAGDETLQKLLTWVNDRHSSVELPYSRAAMRAFYLTLGYDIAVFNAHQRSNHDLPSDLISNSLIVCLDDRFSSDLAQVARQFGCRLYEARLRSRSRRHDPEFAIELANTSSQIFPLLLDLKHQGILQEAKDSLPRTDKQKTFDTWWRDNGKFWAEQLHTVTQYPNIGHSLLLDMQQIELLKQYYSANLFLVECMSSDCYVSLKVRKELEDTLLLPISKIEDNHPVLIG